RAGLERTVGFDGHGGVAGVANERTSRSARHPRVVLDPARAKCALELAVLQVAPRCSGVCRRTALVGADSSDVDGLLARPSSGRCVAHPLSTVGELRVRIELRRWQLNPRSLAATVSAGCQNSANR